MSIDFRDLKVAIVHYWLVTMGGGEKVVETLCDLFPQADIFTHVFDRSAISHKIAAHKISTTFIGRLPAATRLYRYYLPLMPIALEQLDLTGYDLVLSNESGFAKGLVLSPDSVHICYCHTPPRYVWDMYHEYIRTSGILARVLLRPVMHYLRLYDYASAARVDHFVANSRLTATRVRKFYRRACIVLPPPVETQVFYRAARISNFYLMVGRLVSYKRVDLAIDAFNRSGKNLVIIGDGPDYKRLAKRAHKNVRMLGRQPLSVICDHYSKCRALVFPGLEDFGIVPLEAMASGRPVIAFRGGGLLETVVENKTGVFFDEQTPDALNRAVERFERIETRFSSVEIQAYARTYDVRLFKNQISTIIASYLGRRRDAADINRARPSLEYSTPGGCLDEKRIASRSGPLGLDGRRT